ncbi:hypothetical protein GQ44DRAFT_817848 [Phaeosphaeriaceae sp. PMI808]|nr:hypothetical protein GQ44DRAFT_817848 [Phaeosphaeriaceae sp. PMI808]
MSLAKELLRLLQSSSILLSPSFADTELSHHCKIPASFTVLRVVLILAFISSLTNAQGAKCEREHPRIISVLKANYDNGSDIFCRQLLATISMIGTLREDPTLFFYVTQRNTLSTDIVYKYASTTTKKRITKAKANRVGKAITKLRPTVPDVIVEKPSASTITFTETSTRTKLKYATAPYPSNCPGADGIDYVTSDRSQWERGCKTGLNQYRTLDHVKAPNLSACIEKCVDYNNNMGYRQCQAVEYLPKTNDCHRIHEPGYFAHPNGESEVATLRLLPPQEMVNGYCATVTGAARLEAVMA